MQVKPDTAPSPLGKPISPTEVPSRETLSSAAQQMRDAKASADRVGSGREAKGNLGDEPSAASDRLEEGLEDRLRKLSAALANRAAVSSIPTSFSEAQELSGLTRDQILAGRGDAVSVQAHISPRSALALLK